ncbi:MAG: VWA domain-containing protein [Crocosphaera sp.]|nr:VWA domain-containing protein [Crocosphaera sp.]
MNCPTITPSKQPLNFWQQTGLNLISRLHGGRDLIFAIDLTDSVGLNAEGRLRLRQIIEDSLQRGDTVYVVPFATNVLPNQPAIKYTGKETEIKKILETIPLKANLNYRNADIQLAELNIYKKLAQLNQCSLHQKEPLHRQAVVWVTDAPLFTEPGITRDIWIETPWDSPFRNANSQRSQERKAWLETLPLQKRAKTIFNDKNEPYELTVVDIPPTLQEFCTPVPGGQETCLVTPYLIQQLWLPTSLLGLGIVGISILLKTWLSWQQKWKLKVDFYPNSLDEEKTLILGNNRRIYLGEDEPNTIQMPDSETRGYLERKGNRLFLVPLKDASPIFLRGQEINQRIQLAGEKIILNVLDQRRRNQEVEVSIQVKK